jgi:hypothetical protein
MYGFNRHMSSPQVPHSGVSPHSPAQRQQPHVPDQIICQPAEDPRFHKSWIGTTGEDTIYRNLVTELFTWRAPASATAPSLPISLSLRLQYNTVVIKDNTPRRAIIWLTLMKRPSCSL